MQSIFCQPLDIYQPQNNANTDVEHAILQSMSPAPMILDATVIIRDGNLYKISENSDTINDSYETWKYFFGEVEQYADGALRV